MVACRASILSLRSVSLTRINKKQLPVSSPVLYQIRTRFYRMHQCHVSVGRKEARGRATPGDFNCYTKIKVEKSCRVWHCVSVECFDSLNLTASKQPGRKNVDICCWKEKTVYFLLLFLFLLWHWLPTFWALLLSENLKGCWSKAGWVYRGKDCTSSFLRTVKLQFKV